jgi:hypothetical protein
MSGTRDPAEAPRVLLFDSVGHSIPPGGPDFDTYDLAAWPVVEKVSAVGSLDAWTIAIVILPGGVPLPDSALAYCMRCIEVGGAVAFYAPDMPAVHAAMAQIQPFIGCAGHA